MRSLHDRMSRSTQCCCEARDGSDKAGSAMPSIWFGSRRPGLDPKAKATSRASRARIDQTTDDLPPPACTRRPANTKPGHGARVWILFESCSGSRAARATPSVAGSDARRVLHDPLDHILDPAGLGVDRPLPRG